MIEDRVLVPGDYEHPLQSWQLDSPALNAFFVAVLTTILSYQTASVAYDLIFGLKPRYIARASDFHAALLTDEGSLKSICAALLRKDWLDRSRFPRQIPHDTSIAREPRSVKKKVIAKVLILVIVAPVINVLAIIITLERDQDITFAQAKFGGMGVALNDDLSFLESQDFTLTCSRIPFKVEDHQRAVASFFGCIDSDFKDTDGSWLSAETTSDETILLTLVISGILRQISVHFSMEVKQDTFRIRQRMSDSMLRALIKHGNRRVANFCLKNDSSTSDIIRVGDGDGGVRVSRNLSCIEMGNPAISIVLSDMAARVTLVQADSFEVVNDSNLSEGRTEFMRADDLILLEQRTSYVGLGTLFVATGFAMLLRIIVKLLTRNDVHDGITIVLRTCFGVQSGDSLLRWKGTVRYYHKHQEGETAHFGVKNDDLEEVKQFMGGEVGVVDERPCAMVEKCINISD